MTPSQSMHMYIGRMVHSRKKKKNIIKNLKKSDETHLKRHVLTKSLEVKMIFFSHRENKKPVVQI